MRYAELILPYFIYTGVIQRMQHSQFRLLTLLLSCTEQLNGSNEPEFFFLVILRLFKRNMSK